MPYWKPALTLFVFARYHLINAIATEAGNVEPLESSGSETPVWKPKVHPPPEDPFPNQDWDRPRAVFENYEFLPFQPLNENDLKLIFLDNSCIHAFNNMCEFSPPEGMCNRTKPLLDAVERARTKLIRATPTKKVLLASRYVNGPDSDTRQPSSATSAPTITGDWMLSPRHAHLAFDNVIVYRGSSEPSTRTKRSILTITPTAIQRSRPRTVVRALPLSKPRPAKPASPKRRFNTTLCSQQEIYETIRSNACLPLYANITTRSPRPHHEEFLKWLYTFGWEGDRKGVENANSTNFASGNNSSEDVKKLSTVDIPLLLKLGRRIYDLDESPSGLVCPLMPPFDTVNFDKWYGKKLNAVEQFDLPVCFFSTPEPKWKQRTVFRNDTGYEKRYETHCEENPVRTLVAMIKYRWLGEAQTTPAEMVQQAMVEMDPDFEDFEFDVPFMHMTPQRVLQAVELTTPELPPDLPHPSQNANPPKSVEPSPSPRTSGFRFPFGLFNVGMSPENNNGQGVPGSDRQPPFTPVQMTIALGPSSAVIAKGPNNNNVVLFGSSTITAAGPEITVGSHVVRFSGDSFTVDGSSTYTFPSAPPTATSKKNYPGSLAPETPAPAPGGHPSTTSNRGAGNGSLGTTQTSLELSNNLQSLQFWLGILVTILLAVLLVF